MTDDVRGTPTSDPQGIPIVRTLSDDELPPLCCQHAHECGYRRGYRDGYWYALWDVGKHLRVPDTLWQHWERFYYETLHHWVGRATHDTTARVRREPGPRFRTEPVRRQRGDAA